MSKFNIDKKTLQTFFVGFLLGILVLGTTAGVFAKTYIDKTKNNYVDEGTKIVNLVSDAKDPLLQKDYVITGLILSDEFNEFLEEGIQKGLWTEDFLAEFALDYSLPILLKNYSDVLSLVANTDQAKELSKTLSKIAEIITKAKVQWQIYGPKIIDLVHKLKDPNLKTEALAALKEAIWNFLADSGLLEVIANIANKLEIVSFKVKGTISSVKRFVNEILEKLKDPNLKAKILVQVKAVLSQKLTELGLADKIDAIYSKVENIINLLSDIKTGKISQKQIIEFLTTKFASQIEAAKAKAVMAVQEKLAEIKESINLDEIKMEIKAEVVDYVVDHQSEIVAGILNALGNSLSINQDDVQAITAKIDKIIENLQKLYESMPEIKNEINKIIKALEKIKQIIGQIESIDFTEVIKQITDQVQEIKNQINQIIEKVGDAEVVINAIISELTQEDIEKDDWDFIVALKNWDKNLKIYDIPDKIYTKLNILEPVINILTLEIDYNYTPDDGNVFNGNSSHLEINSVEVGVENKTQTIELLKKPEIFDGIVATTIKGVLPVFTDNI